MVFNQRLLFELVTVFKPNHRLLPKMLNDISFGLTLTQDLWLVLKSQQTVVDMASAAAGQIKTKTKTKIQTKESSKQLRGINEVANNYINIGNQHQR